MVGLAPGPGQAIDRLKNAIGVPTTSESSWIFFVPKTLITIVASLSVGVTELSTSSTSTISSLLLLFRLFVETLLTTAIKSVLRFVVMRATSATDRGGTGCCGMLAQISPSNFLRVEFARSTRKGIGVEI